MTIEFAIERADGSSLEEYPIDLGVRYPTIAVPAEMQGPESLHPAMLDDRVAVILTPNRPAGRVEAGAPEQLRQGLWIRPWVVIADSFEERAAALQQAVQLHMDQQAQARRYDDIATAITYADEPAVPRFQAEGRAFRVWRSQVWAFCYWMLDEVAAGRALEPTAAALIAVLPTLELPE